MRVIIYTRHDHLMPTGAADDEAVEVPHLSACFPGDENDEEYFLAHRRLEREGRYWGGGGASPLFLIMRVRT